MKNADICIYLLIGLILSGLRRDSASNLPLTKKMTEATRQFIRDHAEDPLPELLLNACRYPDVDVKAAVVQIKARKQLRDKLPVWCRDERLIFPSTLAAEQCSSEITALYKQRLVHNDDWICDLTGGLGVDTYYFSRKVKHVTYIEKNEACCDAVRSNFHILGITNIHITHSDAVDFLKHNKDRLAHINVYYIDPARRGTGNKRLYAISDCEPDMMKISALLPKRYRMIIKLSPMLDITQALMLIPAVREVHIISVRNECKELLIVAESNLCKRIDNQHTTSPIIYCVNYLTNGTEQSFYFRLADEQATVLPVAKHVGRFLYEPNASLLKAGAFKSVAWQYGVEKLHTSSHLYTSACPVTSFPGRLFEVTAVLPFNNRMCKTIHKTIPQANITIRNFPLKVDELRKRTRINEGGDVYLFATTLPDNQKVLIKCHRFVDELPRPET